jgi:trehalose 6-phosphate phosphatase
VSTEEQGTALEDPTQLAASLGPASRWLVVLDFDGTLSPIVEHPDDAAPAAGAVDAIGALTDVTSVAIVSGRPVAELRARLGDLPVTFAGGHGAEVVTDDGTVTALVDDPDAVRATLDDAERAVTATVGDEPGWLVERKEASLAVHHRRVPADVRERTLPEVVACLEAHLGSSPGFDLLAGKAVLELRPAGVDKGRAVAWIADRAPAWPPLIVGDDVTDEDAFREAGRRGGASVLVAEQPRATLARWRLRNQQEVVTFLTALATQATEGSDGG